MLRMHLYVWASLKNLYIDPIEDQWIDEMANDKDSIAGNVLMQYLKNCMNGTHFVSSFRITEAEEQLCQIKRQILEFMFSRK